MMKLLIKLINKKVTQFSQEIVCKKKIKQHVMTLQNHMPNVKV